MPVAGQCYFWFTIHCVGWEVIVTIGRGGHCAENGIRLCRDIGLSEEFSLTDIPEVTDVPEALLVKG